MRRVVALGELLLRLRAPGAERLLQGAALEATYGGAEFNVLASLARFGLTTDFVTALPEEGLGPSALGAIRQHGIGSGNVERSAGRLGLYFLEAGSGVRSGRVIYDRAESVFARIDPGVFDWPAILRGADWLHLTGITPAVSESAARIAYAAADAAVARGVPVSLDINMRVQLWKLSGREAFPALAPLLRRSKIVFATPGDWAACIRPSQHRPSEAANEFAAFAATLFDEYPAVEVLVAGTRRGSSAADFDVGAIAQRRGATQIVATEIAVRSATEGVGGGDALVGGCLFGLLAGWPDERWLEFGVTARAVKHTIPGDVNLISLAEIETVLRGRTASDLVR
ncbi:MAG: PfkB family carbohydrate kinase [Steroidobacteraceae bacterium]